MAKANENEAAPVSGAEKRLGQHADESVAEYLRRVVNNINYEHEYLLDDMLTVDALLDFHDLQKTYDTDLWEGILECIANGEDPAPARAFVEKHGLDEDWTAYIDDAVNDGQEAREASELAQAERNAGCAR